MDIFRNFKELYKFRELLVTLTLREIKVRYKQTVLGAGWAIIQPLSLMMLFTVVFNFFLKVDTQGIPYPVFSYSGLLPWTFFSTSISFGSLSVINNSNLVGKIYFPKETLPFASIGAALLDFAVAALIYIGLIFFYNITPTFDMLLVIPIIAILIIFTSAITLFSACLVVLWRDIKFVIPLVLQLWIFLVPVIYPVSKIPAQYHFLYSLDPIVPIVDSFRVVTISGGTVNFVELLIATIISIVLFILSYMFFKSKEKVFADII